MLQLPDGNGGEPRDVCRCWMRFGGRLNICRFRCISVATTSSRGGERSRRNFRCTVHFTISGTPRPSFLANAGVDLDTIGMILGHRARRTTQTYRHFTLKYYKSDAPDSLIERF